MDKASYVYVELDPAAMQVKIAPVVSHPGGREILFPTNDKEGFKWGRIDLKGDDLFPRDREKDIMHIDIRMAENLRDELIKMLGNPRRSEVESELDATKYHLEDMRLLLFKKEFPFDRELKPSRK
jgi:hypothetical protein